MKEISVFIRTEDLTIVTDIIRKHRVGGLSFYEINGAGRVEREAIQEIVDAYKTGRKLSPDFVKRTKVETIVPDSAVNQIVEDILDKLSPHTMEKEAHGMIFVKEVADACEIGSRQRGEAVLSSK